MNWSYGILTVPQRLADGLLQRTIISLVGAGFAQPRLFVDGCADASAYGRFGLPLTLRDPAMRVVGNWILSLWELLVRTPEADRYAVFQDDFVTYKNLRQYLEQTEYPKQGYLNLNTFPQNQEVCPQGHTGWYLSNQRGLSAVALVFDREAVTTLLSQAHLIRKVQDPKRGCRSVDGAIVTALKQASWKEYVHNPSLVQHTGDVSAVSNKKHPQAPSFRGEDFDVLSLLKQETG